MAGMQRWLRGIPLRRLLVVPFTLQVLVGVGTVGYLSWLTGQRAVGDLVERLELEVSDRIVDNLRSFVETPHQINQANVDAVTLGRVSMTDMASWEKPLWLQVQRFPDINFIKITHADGRERTGEQLLDGSRTINVVDGFTQNRFHAYAADEQGRRTKLVVEVPGYDGRTYSFYTNAVRIQQPTWSGTYVSLLEPTLLMSASQPIYGPEQQVLGVASAALRLDGSGAFCGGCGWARPAKRSSWNGMAICWRLLLQKCRFGWPPSPASPPERRRVLAQDSTDALTALASQTLNPVQATLQEPRSWVAHRNGQRYFVQARPFGDRQGLDWLVVTVIPEVDFLAEIYANAWQTFYWCLLTLAIAIGSGWAISNWILAPIFELNHAAKQILQGQWTSVTAGTRQDELGELARTFGWMVSRLQDSFETLEQRVAARTLDLEKANREIANLNACLQAENTRLGMELQIARRLQQAILPRAKEFADIDDLDIDAHVESAAEVGGDYFDILRENGTLRISIGDVTGHGLESGIFAIMAQTAMRTLTVAGETDAPRVLTALNKTMYQSLQRMGCDKSLTLSLLDYRHGRLRIAGQHEEAVVVRRHGAIERIDTLDLGFPIGLVEHIQEFVAFRDVELQTGDVVILFTDGVTEAANCQHDLYGLDRLCRVVQKHIEASAQTICQAAIQDLRQHIGAQDILDDITLVVLKQR
ncbi:MAG: SpoIIE family protein phosphatase [Oscillatoriales cyanobacterium SM2_1_8]|nr:SpoIIE family protein phosphatase [Oscillatoriales cyanobacterium SM2_1_8]